MKKKILKFLAGICSFLMLLTLIGLVLLYFNSDGFDDFLLSFWDIVENSFKEVPMLVKEVIGN